MDEHGTKWDRTLSASRLAYSTPSERSLVVWYIVGYAKGGCHTCQILNRGCSSSELIVQSPVLRWNGIIQRFLDMHKILCLADYILG